MALEINHAYSYLPEFGDRPSPVGPMTYTHDTWVTLLSLPNPTCFHEATLLV
ncbi:MAG: hypothetical protein HC919_03415 [Oscillatoriales cyanobacterium SM2_2_1]|nr:hypothetical protein [Oscillatoriales cyanobacterium SM2_2_1]